MKHSVTVKLFMFLVVASTFVFESNAHAEAWWCAEYPALAREYPSYCEQTLPAAPAPSVASGVIIHEYSCGYYDGANSMTAKAFGLNVISNAGVISVVAVDVEGISHKLTEISSTDFSISPALEVPALKGFGPAFSLTYLDAYNSAGILGSANPTYPTVQGFYADGFAGCDKVY